MISAFLLSHPFSTQHEAQLKPWGGVHESSLAPGWIAVLAVSQQTPQKRAKETAILTNLLKKQTQKYEFSLVITNL